MEALHVEMGLRRVGVCFVLSCSLIGCHGQSATVAPVGASTHDVVRGCAPLESCDIDGAEHFVGSSPGSGLGHHVAWSEDLQTLAIGAPGEELEVDRGGIHVLRRSSGTWALEGTLRAPRLTPTRSRCFELGGIFDISADGDTLVAGCPSDDRPPGGDELGLLDNAGAVYVFRRQGGQWALEATLTDPVAQENHHLGDAVSVSPDGTRIAAGVRGWEQGRGAIVLFSRGESEWAFAERLTNDRSDEHGGFGRALALTGDPDLLFAGVPSRSMRGAVFVLRREADAWSSDVLVPEPSQPVMAFGSSLAVSSDSAVLAVGAPVTEVLGQSRAGAVFMFRRGADGSFGPDGVLRASDPGSADEFGGALAVSADGARVAVGAPFEDSREEAQPAGDAGSDVGAVYLFDRGAAGQWTETAFLKGRLRRDLDYFGFSLALAPDGSELAVGACGDIASETAVRSRLRAVETPLLPGFVAILSSLP